MKTPKALNKTRGPADLFGLLQILPSESSSWWKLILFQKCKNSGTILSGSVRKTYMHTRTILFHSCLCLVWKYEMMIFRCLKQGTSTHDSSFAGLMAACGVTSSCVLAGLCRRWRLVLVLFLFVEGRSFALPRLSPFGQWNANPDKDCILRGRQFPQKQFLNPWRMFDVWSHDVKWHDRWQHRPKRCFT